MDKTGWIIFLVCECNPYTRQYVTSEMVKGNPTVNIHKCGYCGRPLAVIGKDGHLYIVGERMIENCAGQ